MDIIPVANVVTTEEDARAVYEVVKSGWISKGKKVDAFEADFARVVGARHAIAVSNGTAALHVILAALGIGPGDEVVLPSLTFISTANAVLYLGATPVLVECAPDTYNVTPEILEAAVTPRTKALVPVDMNGMPVDYNAVLALGERLGIPVVSDSAESLGASYKGRRIGGVSPIGFFSFFPNKTVTTGEGGMITCSDDAFAERCRVLLNQGQEGRYNHVALGFNYRMTDIAAALGIVQLSRLDSIVAEKNNIVAAYREFLADAPGVSLPVEPAYVTQHSWYMFAVQVDEAIRDAVVAHLKDKGVDTRLSFPPIHNQPYYRERFGSKAEDLPVTWRTWRRLINLPIWPGLTREQIAYVAATLKEAVAACS
ncbi:UDP-4-amino-4-deoxy-L-arabinose--oxoglutarate aminotransferase [Fundidesulfovibrio magnetotacticus]|uniref:UDP-4-amino-4-deoxy-L-arabinose--oxoglutarate aminotransferase n=1 Tax=Fundidesulfovibrio magnetotacticus TaxID=2730080 RepID=A0A6V8LXP5_9BACT|nr:DegT/DnrJ/EryC1/StrS family aminotransferase [Fundidesulfovibrio magnetotacticus]GFK94829.1 UDP-4-amino-4-deoxy-L-arabinose--oxoglutarate aminotransferase [Fundidesulfovibrio magnetotacticus]